MSKLSYVQWRTVLLFVLTYVGWLGLTLAMTQYSSWLVIALVFALTLHSSLQHEVIHGHPTPWQAVNSSLASPALGLFLPFERFEFLHLQHHRDWLITDPFDDTESSFLSTSQWQSLSPWVQRILIINNTLLGRLVIGPWIMYARFFGSECHLLLKRSPGVLPAWIKHAIGVLPVLLWLHWIDLSLSFYVLAAVWPSTSILLLRAYTEHLPTQDINQRSAIVRSGKLMSLLYLNNNLHRVHHDFPELPWYSIPARYREHYAHQNGDHQIVGYCHLLRRYAFRPRYPVAHPFLRTESIDQTP